jgi:NADPH-dependent curcumin reductase CurA
MTTDLAQGNRRVLLTRHPEAEPSDDCYTLETAPVPVLGDGEALVAVRHLSIDPAQRIWMNPGGAYGMGAGIGHPMLGIGVGEVVASNNDAYPVGAHLTGMFGWQEYAVVDSQARKAAPLPAGIEGPAALGVYGMNGQTAYWGLIDVGDPQPGQTVLVSAAAGATGSIVGQIARIVGARVVGLAGTEAKRSWLVDELGFDAALDYRDEKLPELLDEACPNGVDVYFDNVGGALLDLALERLAMRGRVIICGAISAYNDNEWGPGPSKYRMLLRQRGRMEGFVVMDYAPRYGEALEKLRGWVADGSLRHREDVTVGLENAPEALRRVLRGDHFGKVVVSV